MADHGGSVAHISKGGENQAISNEEGTLQNITNTVNSLIGQYGQTGLPALQTLMPLLLNAVQGKPSTLTTAAEAPVNAQTASNLANAKQQASGLVNPDQLYENIAKSGQTQAGLAADQVTLGSLGDINSLISGQQGLVSSGLSELPQVASGYGNIAQMLDPWQAIASIVGAGATAYGASQGMKGASGGRGATTASAATAPTTASQPLSLPQVFSGQPWNSPGNTNVSAPTSQINRQTASAGAGPSLSQMPFYGA